MNYRYDPEDAHATRAIVIELEPNNDAEMIVRGLFGAPDLEEERTALEAGASVAKVNWGNGKMETHMKSKKFIDRVRNLDAKLPRGTQVGAVLLAISDAMGWNAEDVIKRYVSEEREDGLQTVREVLLEIYEKHEKEVRNGVLELPNKDVHPELNARLRRIGLPTVGKKEWARIRREVSIHSKLEKFAVVLLFRDKARMAIGARSTPSHHPGFSL